MVNTNSLPVDIVNRNIVTELFPRDVSLKKVVKQTNK